MERGKIIANRGVERNKKPLQNLLYWFEDGRPDEAGNPTYNMLWAYERDYNRQSGGSKNFHGQVTLEQIKARLTASQWSKFRQGVRHFVKQRRVDGKNVPKKK